MSESIEQNLAEKKSAKKNSRISFRILITFLLVVFFLMLLESDRVNLLLDRQAAEYDLPWLHETAGLIQITANHWGFTAISKLESNVVKHISKERPLCEVKDTSTIEQVSPQENLTEKIKAPEMTEEQESPEVQKLSPSFSEPLRSKPLVLLVGDSLMMEGFGPALQRALRARPDLEVIREGKYSTGLSRLDYFNWETHLTYLVKKDTPDLVVICLGANDPQDIIDEKGKRHHADSTSWAEMYQNRAEKLLQAATSQGARVIWVGLPVMSKEPYSTRIRRLSTLQQNACEDYPAAARYVDTMATLADSKGGYMSYDVDAKGQTVRLRYKDKVHVTEEGGRRMTLRVLPFIFTDLGLPLKIVTK